MSETEHTASIEVNGQTVLGVTYTTDPCWPMIYAAEGAAVAVVTLLWIGTIWTWFTNRRLTRRR